MFDVNINIFSLQNIYFQFKSLLIKYILYTPPPIKKTMVNTFFLTFFLFFCMLLVVVGLVMQLGLACGLRSAV